MRGQVYILTVNLPQPTRIQCGCLNEMTSALLSHAGFTDTFDSFTRVSPDMLPVRDEDELRRGASFIKDALDSNLTANVKGH
jgi:hypothetical protein